jgi:hypothetical protein
MRIYKKDERLFRLFSLLLVLCLSAAVLLPSEAKNEARQGEGFFVLQICEAEEALVPCLHVGDRMIDRQSRSILGDISEIRTEESRREVFSAAKGRLVSARVPERCDIFLKIGAEKKNGALFTMGGAAIRIGDTLHFRTCNFTGTGRVVELI